MVDTVLNVIDSDNAVRGLKAVDGGASGLTPYHIEDPAQREAMLEALAELDPNAKLEAIRVLLAGTRAVSVATLPLPAGAATQATLEAVRVQVATSAGIDASILAVLDNLGTEDTLEAIRVLLTATRPVSVSSLPLPGGAATETTLEAVRGLLATTRPVSVSSLPLPGGAASESTLEAVRLLLAATRPVSVATLPLPAGAATQTTLAAVLTALSGPLMVEQMTRDNTGQLFSLDSLPQVITRNGAGDITTISATNGTNTWIQTFTYTAGEVTGISAWVRQ